MSARTQMIRKLDGGQKPTQRELQRGASYLKWSRGLQARLANLFNWEGYLKHATHSANMIRSINEDRERRARGGDKF